MKIALCPGSFDPVTLGHIDIIERTAELFDKVIVLVMSNSAKHSLFSIDERVELLKRCIKNSNVEVDTYNGLLVDYAKRLMPLPLLRACVPFRILITNFSRLSQIKACCRRLKQCFWQPRAQICFYHQAW